jgi:hypothetical protein
MIIKTNVVSSQNHHTITHPLEDNATRAQEKVFHGLLNMFTLRHKPVSVVFSSTSDDGSANLYYIWYNGRRIKLSI